MFKKTDKNKSKNTVLASRVLHWSDGLHLPTDALALEERIMLDAAAVESVLDFISSPNDSANDESHDDLPVASAPDYAHTRHEIVFIDTSIDGFEDLIADVVDNTDVSSWQKDSETGVSYTESVIDNRVVTVYAIDGKTEGFAPITDVLANQQDIDAVHVLSHGVDGGILFGDSLINSDSIAANAEDLSVWGSALNQDGDFLLYGCNTGATDTGIAFVKTFAELTGADVLASNDPTGNAAHGGDWDMEVSQGQVESELVTLEDAQENFDGVLAATPAAIVDTPSDSFINEPFEFCISFENPGSDPGYEPFMDVILDPGIDVSGASYLGSALDTSNTFTWNGGQWVDAGGAPVTEHPLGPDIPLPPNPGITGSTWIHLDLPFGSFVPGQPPAKIAFDATLDPAAGATVGSPLGISAIPGFELGEDSQDNPDSDPPIIGSASTQTVTPTVMEVEKTAQNAGFNAIGAEQEQGTGPNNPLTYTITVDVADGQTINNMVLNDVIPNHLHYLGNVTVGGSGAQAGVSISDATIGVSNGNLLSVSFTSVTGTAGVDDVVITFDAYIPDFDANGDSIIDPLTGLPSHPVVNDATVQGNYNGAAVSDTDDERITPKSLAIQKTVVILDSSGNPTGAENIKPGDLLEWTLVTQVSDYFSLDEFIIDDQFGDGQLYVPGSAMLSTFENGVSTGPVSIAAGNVTLNSIDPATGLTLITYDIANQIDGGSGQIDGDLYADNVLTGKSSITVTFRTEVQEEFQYAAIFGGDSSIDIGDIISNNVDVNAEVTGTDNPVTDDSSASVSVALPVQSKSIYAINGDTDNWDQADPEIAPGQTITYRITIELPTTDVEHLVITDYMPLPVFAVPGGYDYVGFFSGVDNAPAPGEFGFGPSTNPADFPAGFFNSTGTNLDIASVTTDPVANTIVWDFNSFDNPNSTPGTIDLLFTTMTADIPFADGLNLTNQTQISFDNTNNPQPPVNSIVQIEPVAPELSLTKGVVSVDSASNGVFAPGVVGPVGFNDAGSAGPAFAGLINSSGIDATPIDSNVSDLDAGDVVRFALTIENTGGFESTDITISDNFPAGFAIPAGGLNMQAALGDGTALTVNGNLFDAAGNPDATGISFNQGAGEVELGKGRDDATPIDDGSNIIVVTYDLVLTDDVLGSSVLPNTAEILTFAAFDGGADYTDGNTSADWSDDADVTVSTPSIEKNLISTGIDNSTNAANEVVGGEYITYEVVLTLPEGSFDSALIRDRLDNLLVFDSLVSVTPSSPDIVTDIAGGFGNVVAPASGSTGNLTFQLGNVTNQNVDNTVVETLTLIYRVYADGAVINGGKLNNRADFRWDQDGDGNPWNDPRERDSAPNVTVISPELEVIKSIDAPTPTDVGDPISYTIIVQHTAASDTDAFDAHFLDTIPAEIGSVSLVSALDSGGSAVPGFTLTGNQIENTNFDLAFGETVTIKVTGTVVTAVTGSAIVNTANVDWTALDDGNPGDGVDAEEDTGTASDTAEFVVAPPQLEKTIVSTGINTVDNDNTEVVEGEYIVYRLVTEIPEGVTPIASIVDTLPANLSFDGSFIPTVVLNSPDLSVTTPGTPPTVSGQTVSFDFGDIINSNNDNGSVETITIEYRVFVDGAVSGDTPTNTANMYWDVDGDGSNTGPADGSQTDSTTVTVLEPLLEVIKSLTTTPSDAGDVVTYTIVIKHTAASETDAYDATFNDVLPTQISGVSLVSALDGTGSAVSGFTVSGNTVSNSDYDLALNDQITLIVTGTLNTTATASSTVENTASIDWDTLGDDAEGNQATEGTGTSENSADFVVASPTFEKNIVSTGINDASNDNTQVVAGEYVTYALVVTVPEGTTPLAEITDTLDPDLIFDPTFAITAVGSAGVSITGPATTPTVVGTQVNFDLGTITNTDVDDAVPDTVTITYRVYADSDVVLTDALPNDATLIWDGDNDGDNTDPEDGALSDTTVVTVLGPELEVLKSITTVPSDAGDTIEYTFTVQHTGASTAGAFDASFTDILPIEIDAVSVSATVGAGLPFAGFVITPGATQDTIENPDFDLALGEVITVTVTGTVNVNASASSTVANTVNIDWDSLGDDAQGNQSEETSGTDDAGADFVVASPTFEKNIISTGINDASNDNTQVVAGEYVTYELVVTVPEGTTPLAEITDTLDSDLIFDPTFTITAVGSAGVSITGPATTPTVIGTQVNFDLGTITNTDIDDAVPDTVTITYRVYADSDVVLTDALPNDATLIWDGDNDGDNTDPEDGALSDTTVVTVLGPELEVLKSITTIPSDAGDTIEYTFTVQHTGASTTGAFDVSFSDILPSEIDAVSVSAVDSAGAAFPGFVISPGATQDTIENTHFDLAFGEVVTITVTGTVNVTATASSTVANTVNIDWDSLGDDTQGNQSEETGGTDDADADFVVASPTFEKNIVSTGIDDAVNNNTQVVAGEYVTYELVVTVPEGTTPLAEITDTLDSDLIFDPSFAITAVGSAGVSFTGPATAPIVAGTQVSFDLGTITNNDVSDAVPDTVTITYRVYADTDVVLADSLPNDATLIWDGDNDGDNTDPEDGALSDTTVVTVLAPELVIAKDVTLIPSDHGDPIEYTIEIRHSDASDAPVAVSNATAHDIYFSDPIPAGITGVSVSAVDGTGAALSGFTVTGNLVEHPSFDLAVGDTITVTVTGIAGPGIVEGDTITNISTVEWGTLEEDNDDGVESAEADGSANDDASFSLGDISKSIVSTGIDDASNDNLEAVTGEYITYQLDVEIPQGQTNMAELVDVLDAGLVFDAAFPVTVTPSSANLTTSLAPGDFSTVTPALDAATNTLNFVLGDLTNSAPVGTVEKLTITYQVFVANDNVTAATGTALNNDVDFKWDIDGDGSNDGPDDGSTSASAPDVLVIEPELEIVKTIDTVPSDAGDTIVYKFVIQHTAASQAGAFDATFTDTLPTEISGVTLVSVLDSSGANVPGFSVAGNTVSSTDYDLALTDTITILVSGVVNNTASASTTVDNIATIDWDTLGDDGQGSQADETGGSDSDDAEFVVASPTFDKIIVNTGINDASNNNTQVVAGEYVTYALVVTVPEGTTPLAEITDTLDPDLIFDPTFSITAVGSSGVTFTGPATAPSVAGTQVSFDLGTITNNDVDNAVADTVTITYRVYADSDVVLTDSLPNNATLIWDGDNDGDNTDLEDGALTDGTVVTVLGTELEVLKAITIVPSDAGDTIEYTFTVQHTGASTAGAFDVSFSDILPAEIDAVSVSAEDSSGAAFPGFIITPGAIQDTIENAHFDVALGEVVTVTVTGTVNVTASASTTVANTVNIDWDSLGDDTQGNQAEETGGTDDAGADFVVASPTFDKNIVNTGINDGSNDDTQVVAGEFVTYELVVTVPEGTTPLAQITDTLDTDLIFDPTFAITAVGSAGVSISGPATSPVVSGAQVSFDLGTIVNANVDDSAPDTVTITYRVYADSDVVLTDSLPNDATFIWDADNDGDNTDPEDGSLTDGTVVTVLGTELEVLKSITTVPSDAGDTIEYTFTVQHTGASTAGAFDASFTDILPSEIDAVSVVAVDSTGAAFSGFVITPGATQDTIENPDFDLALGEVITITVTGTVNVTASASSTVDNSVNIDWDSLGDDSQGNQSEETGGTDDAGADFVVASPTFDKSIVGTGISDSTNGNTQVVAGEFVTYSLLVTVPEGTTPLAEITDTLDPDLIFDPSFTITASGSAGVSFTGPATAPTVTGSQVSFDLGTITNTNVDDAMPDTVEITYRVYADTDVVLSDALPNDATLIWDGDNDGDNTDPEDGVLSDTTAVTVLSPELVIDKVVSVIPSDHGDPIEYTIEIRHTTAADAPSATSNATAYDVHFIDPIPVGITAVSVTAVDASGVAVPGFVLDTATNTIENPSFDLGVGETITLTVSGIADTGIVEGDTVTNVSTIDWGSLDEDSDDGFDAGEATDTDDDDASFSLGEIQKSIVSTGIDDASNDNLEAVTGEYITYQLEVDIPQGQTDLAEIEDVLDAGLVFDAGFPVVVTPSSANLATSLVPGDFSSVVATLDTTSNTLSFALGDITNSAPDGTVETLTITYQVYVANDALTAPMGATLNNAVDFKWDIDGDGSNDGPGDGSTEAEAPEVVVIAPELEIVKTIETVPSDAGDTIVYQFVIQHTGASQAGAFDATFSDVLPGEISNVTLVSALDSTGVSVAGFGVSGNTVSSADFDLALNDTITVLVSGVVNVTASASSTVDNVADISWDTLGDDSQGSQSDESGGTDSDDAEFVLASPDFQKSIVSTGIDDPSNDHTQVVAGEYVTYSLLVTVPEGTTPMAQITDTLDPDLIFDSSFGITAVGSSGVVFTGPATLPVVSGNQVVFDLGTITNSDVNDAAPDTVEITYRVYADTDVVLGEVLPNDATLIWDGNNDGDNTSVADGVLTDGTTVTVLVPELVIAKEVTAIPSDHGDTVEYTIEIRHSDVTDAPLAMSNAIAHDIYFSDAIPSGITGISVSAADSSGVSVPGFTVTGNLVEHASFDLPVGEVITVTITGIASTSILEGDTITNVSDIVWGTLEEDNDDGNETAEASDSDTDDASFSLGEIQKSIISTGINDAVNDNAEAVAGEFVTYQLLIDIPQGQTNLAEIEDTLASGLIFDSNFPVTVTPSSGNLSTSLAPGDFSSVAATLDSASNTVSFDLGNIVNTAPFGTVETLTVIYQVYIANDATNAAQGAVLDNSVEFKWDIDGDGSNDGSTDGSTEATTPVQVVAPELEVLKSIVDFPGETNDSITYQFIVQHTAQSSAGAYDVSFSDALPAGLTGLVIESAIDSNGAVVAGFVLTGNTLSQPSFDLAYGETVTVTVTGVVSGAINSGDTIPNTAEITWGSLDADSANDGADSYGPGNEGTGSDDDSASFSISDLNKSILSTGINNADNNDSEVTVGEYVTYQVVIDVPQGNTDLAEIVDTLDAGLAFDTLIGVQASSDLSTSHGVGNFSDIVSPGYGSTGSISFDLGDITNSNTDNTQTETITLTYRVFATNTAPVSVGALLNNSAQFQWDIDGDGSNDGAADGNTAAAAPDVVVHEPQISIAKSVDDTVPHLGQAINYTVNVTNENTPYGTDAYDVFVSDPLPAGMVLDLNSITVNGVSVSTDANVSNLSSGNTLSLVFAELDFDSETSIGYTAVVSADTADVNANLANTVSVNWSTLSDTNSGDGVDASERGPSDGYINSSSEAITLTAPDYAITKSSSNNAALSAGESFSYTIIVSNVGTHEGTGVVVTDAFPVTALTAPVAISNGGSFDAATGDITWNLGGLAVNQSITLTVDAVVANPQTVNVDGDDGSVDDAFSNAVSVTDDGLNGDDPDLSNNATSDTDSVVAAPDYLITKTNDIEMASPTNEFSYQISATNTGTQAGTNVVIVDTYPVEILSVVDSNGGSIDATAGTITWNIPLMAVDDVVNYNVVVSVLPSANLDTADQLFTNSISIGDDGLNGDDTNPGNNQDSHSDMLLAGPGDPLTLIATGTSESPNATILSGSGFERPMEQLEIGEISEPRYISGDVMKMGQSVNTNYEDDVLNGGALLDTFSNNPIQLCEVHWIDNPWSGERPEELDNDELLDLFIPDDQTTQINQPLDDEISGDLFLNHETSHLSDQFERESNNLFGKREVDIVELMQDLLLNQDVENVEQGQSGSETVQVIDTLAKDTTAGDTSETSDAA